MPMTPPIIQKIGIHFSIVLSLKIEKPHTQVYWIYDSHEGRLISGKLRFHLCPPTDLSKKNPDWRYIRPISSNMIMMSKISPNPPLG